VEYPVNKTWAELGDMFDLTSPEKAAASFNLRAVGGSDLATLLDKVAIGIAPMPEGSMKLNIPAEEDIEPQKITVVEVLLYRSDLAGVISFGSTKDHFSTECLARQDGKWKIYFTDDLDFTLTKEAAVRQFKNQAERLLQKIDGLANQPPPALAAPAGELSNGIVQMTGALGTAMQQLQGSMMGGPVQQTLTNMADLQARIMLEGARAGNSSGSGSFTVVSPFGGPPITYEWNKNGTNFTVKTNQ
jgi:hypothetical protein